MLDSWTDANPQSEAVGLHSGPSGTSFTHDALALKPESSLESEDICLTSLSRIGSREDEAQGHDGEKAKKDASRSIELMALHPEANPSLVQSLNPVDSLS
jgi:hypothetical protein